MYKKRNHSTKKEKRKQDLDLNQDTNKKIKAVEKNSSDWKIILPTEMALEKPNMNTVIAASTVSKDIGAPIVRSNPISQIGGVNPLPQIGKL